MSSTYFIIGLVVATMVNELDTAAATKSNRIIGMIVVAILWPIILGKLLAAILARNTDTTNLF